MNKHLTSLLALSFICAPIGASAHKSVDEILGLTPSHNSRLVQVQLDRAELAVNPQTPKQLREHQLALAAERWMNAVNATVLLSSAKGELDLTLAGRSDDHYNTYANAIQGLKTTYENDINNIKAQNHPIQGVIDAAGIAAGTPNATRERTRTQIENDLANAPQDSDQWRYARQELAHYKRLQQLEIARRTEQFETAKRAHIATYRTNVAELNDYHNSHANHAARAVALQEHYKEQLVRTMKAAGIKDRDVYRRLFGSDEVAKDSTTAQKKHDAAKKKYEGLHKKHHALKQSGASHEALTASTARILKAKKALAQAMKKLKAEATSANAQAAGQPQTVTNRQVQQFLARVEGQRQGSPVATGPYVPNIPSVAQPEVAPQRTFFQQFFGGNG